MYKSRTKYTCRNRGVAKSIEANRTRDGRLEGVAESNSEKLGQGCRQTKLESIEALGGNSTSINMGDTSQGISGVESSQAGSTESESLDQSIK